VLRQVAQLPHRLAPPPLGRQQRGQAAGVLLQRLDPEEFRSLAGLAGPGKIVHTHVRQGLASESKLSPGMVASASR